MIPKRSTAALPPHPLPFFSCATGALAPAFGFAGAGLAAPGFGTGGGFAAAGFDAGGAALGAGAGTAGAGLVGGVDRLICSITRVPPPFATDAASSVGSNTSEISPNRTVAPGASGASPLI